jgi:hypothetical protein
MISTDNKLFHERELSDILREQLSNAQKEVDKITKRYFQSNSDDQIIQHIYSKMEILPLEIQPEAGEITEPQETKIKDLNVFHDVVVVKGVGLEYSLPYHGNLDLWRYILTD